MEKHKQADEQKSLYLAVTELCVGKLKSYMGEGVCRAAQSSNTCEKKRGASSIILSTAYGYINH